MIPPMRREGGLEGVLTHTGGTWESSESSCEGTGEMLFQEGEEDGEDEEGESDEVVPVDGLPLEDEQDDDGEDREGDDFLDDLELDEVERASVLGVTDAVGGDGQAVLEESYAPREQDDQDERPSGRNLHFTQFEMPVPCERHEDV